MQDASNTTAGLGLGLGLVAAVTEQSCSVAGVGGVRTVEFASFFPRPRMDRVAPGHLVALATAGGVERIVWRWFDAVVVGREGPEVLLWEPFHGVVGATPRDESTDHAIGARAYCSSGLPGAAWWLAGSAVARAADADVELDLVATFLTDLGLVDIG